MSAASTKRFASAYKERAGAPLFLASFFDRTYHNSSKVELDVQRAGRPVAVAVRDLSSGAHLNLGEKFTVKEWEPPVFREKFGLQAHTLVDRALGDNPYADLEYMGKLNKAFHRGLHYVEEKIRRAVELQCAQIFQTGKVTCIDRESQKVYEVDFGMKDTHHPGASVDWDEPDPDPLFDLEALSEVIRVDGKSGLGDVLFGVSAWAKFVSDPKIQKLLDNRRIVMGEIRPRPGQESATLRGTLSIGGDEVRLWTYRASYDHPETGVDTPYISPWNVIGIGSNAQYDLTFGSIPRVAPVAPQLAPLALGRMSDVNGIDLSTHIWIEPDASAIFGEAGTRALAIPTAIDTFAVLNAKVS